MLFSLMCFSHALHFAFVIKIYDVMRMIFFLITREKELIGDLSCEEWEQCIYGAKHSFALENRQTGLYFLCIRRHSQRDTRELTHSFFSPNEGLQFALLQQDSHGCNMHLRNMALHRGPREMRENNSIARRCQKLAAVFRNSKVSLFFCCTIRNI